MPNAQRSNTNISSKRPRTQRRSIFCRRANGRETMMDEDYRRGFNDGKKAALETIIAAILEKVPPGVDSGDRLERMVRMATQPDSWMKRS